MDAEARAKSRVSFLTVAQMYAVDVACSPIAQAFDGNPPYLVGSVLQRPNFRDVDLRLMLPDERFEAMFDNKPALDLINVAISEWMSSRTGLPIDFQFQRQSTANAQYPDRPNHPRNPRGLDMRPKRSATALTPEKKD